MSMTAEAPMVNHFSPSLISVFLGNRYMYIIAVYIASMATVMLGFLMNLIKPYVIGFTVTKVTIFFLSNEFAEPFEENYSII